jgi:hypothetical protein
MNPLQRSLIEAAGYHTGWENVREGLAEAVGMYSARHKAESVIEPAGESGEGWRVRFPKGPPKDELAAALGIPVPPDGTFQVASDAGLRPLLRRAAELARSLPNQAAETFAEEVAKLEAQPPTTTEALRLVKQRVGQDLYRKALLEYWGGACAVTGLDLPAALRASHAKPWADCATDEERLDAFNGFLLASHLDALFDAGLMTFEDTGEVRFSSRVTPDHLEALGITAAATLKLRWIRPSHLPYLAWHRAEIFKV